jgi:DNA-binding NarL/FixJ family response regulator
MGLIKILVADDHHLVRQGLRMLLERQTNVVVVGEAADGREAVNKITELKPHIALLDIAMPLLDGIQVTQQIAAAKLSTKVIILSMHSDSSIVKRVLRAGAHGYLLKQSISAELELAIRAAMDGHIYLSPRIASLVLNDILTLAKDVPEALSEQLTPREREVLQLVAEGNTNQEIAELLVISKRTVEKHRSNVMKKLDAPDLPALISAAIKHNLVFLD